jgi:hypothetical protein
MVATLAFRAVYGPTELVGRVVAWLAAGYRTARPLERALILPTWAFLRLVFLAGCLLAEALHARRPR